MSDAGSRRGANPRIAREPFNSGESKEPGEPRPRLFIPYSADDDGDRTQPFPAGTLSYWCPGITITLPDGSRYVGGEIPRYPESSVTVDVANSGDRAANAQVSVNWSEPSVGFTPPYLKRAPVLGSPVSVDVPPMTTVTSPPISLLPGSTAPGHMCLVAAVSDVYDPPSGTWDPNSDGHYAQHNLDVVPMDPDGVGAVTFYVVNPFPDIAATVEVSVRAASPRESETLATALHATWRELDPAALRLLTVGGPGAQEPARELRLPLDGGERQLCQGLVMANGLPPDEFLAIQIETTTIPRNSDQRRPRHASFGTVFFARG